MFTLDRQAPERHYRGRIQQEFSSGGVDARISRTILATAEVQYHLREGGRAMAVRDFVDEEGTKWRVWPVLRSSIHPKTAAEDYLGEYGDGWLCFESANERRRLARYPEDWERMTDKELCRLLQRAAVVPVRGGGKHTPPKPGDSISP